MKTGGRRSATKNATFLKTTKHTKVEHADLNRTCNKKYLLPLPVTRRRKARKVVLSRPPRRPAADGST